MKNHGIKNKVFLGGTCNGSTWRNRMMVYLYDDGMEYYNPIVDDWDEDAQKREIIERENCDFCLYTITPKMNGVYSIAEVIDDSNKRPDKTILVLLREEGGIGFTDSQWKSLANVGKMVIRNGGKVFDDLKSTSVYMRDINKLLPCPFCGGDNLTSDFIYNDPYTQAWVECEDCEIVIDGDTKEEVIDKWNRRDL